MRPTDDAAILEAIARATWDDCHKDTPCPPEAIPTPETLRDWLSECSHDALEAANERLHQMCEDGASGSLVTRKPTDGPNKGKKQVDINAMVLGPEGSRYHSIASVHETWAHMHEAERPNHPLGPIVRAWQQRAISIEPERRNIGKRCELPTFLSLM